MYASKNKNKCFIKGGRTFKMWDLMGGSLIIRNTALGGNDCSSHETLTSSLRVGCYKDSLMGDSLWSPDLLHIGPHQCDITHHEALTTGTDGGHPVLDFKSPGL